MDLVNSNEDGPATVFRSRQLPSLEKLTRLTALSLADNAFTLVPRCLDKLKALEYLDMSLNQHLKVGRTLPVMPPDGCGLVVGIILWE